MYWKNKPPHAAYWQQDVAYKIDAEIDETTDMISGYEQLTYTNNSPDTLNFVFFHLYQNAFLPGSYLDQLQRANGTKPTFGKYESSQRGIAIESISIAKIELRKELDNTILKVYLDKPLLPNSATTFDIKFKTYYDTGSTRRRMKKYKSSIGITHYNGCQWYPKISVYDHHAGWNTDQHLNREFYGDFGSWDVNLTFASNYVVEATGVLQNENEVLPDTLKKKLQISNFKDKKWDEIASIITPYKRGQTKTWRYHADNVHDFAFTADPTYRIADTMWNGVRCVAIVQEPHASGWQNAAAYTAQIIKCFSEDFGMYEYPKMVVADAQDGMEYPMLTLDGGKDPGYRGLLVHEVGHNWFYGMIGSNETYRAMLDEGFTQFLTVWGMNKIDGENIINEPEKNKYVNHFSKPQNVRDSRAYYGYLMDATIEADEQLNTHSDMFHGAIGQGGGYRHVYMKTATMLYNLQYLLGDSLFSKAMKHYVTQWKMCHPYPEDFRNSIIQFTKADLNWFFDQWMETTKNIDYRIKKIKKSEMTDYSAITLERKGRMQMPIDLQVVSKKDSVYNFYIPNTWFEKSIDSATSKLPKWTGWDKLNPTYTAVVKVPHGIKNVIIDPSLRLADINNFDNRLRGNIEWLFDAQIPHYPTWKKQRIYLRPDLWYNSYDGFKVGLHAHGNYMRLKHQFSLNVWLNTHLVQGGFYSYTKTEKQQVPWVSYRFDYSTPLDPIMRNTRLFYHSRMLDGVEMYKLGLNKRFEKGWSIEGFVKFFSIPKLSYANYLHNQSNWSTFLERDKAFNSSINIAADYRFTKNTVHGHLRANVRSATLFNTSSYHYLELIYKQTVPLWRFDLRTRVYGRAGVGDGLPNESALYFSGANAEEMLDNKYMRAAGFFPQSWSSYGASTSHLHYGGGLNLRGYSGYKMSEIDKNGNLVFVYKGCSGAAINAELDFNRIVRFRKNKLRQYFDLNTYLFADAGSIVYRNSTNKQQFSKVRMDAGVGMALTIKRWGFLQEINPLTIRFDIPFFLSHSPAAEGKNIAWRWAIGISRAF